MRMKLLSLAVMSALLAACAGDDDGTVAPAVPASTASGVFLDSAVSGISYKGAQHSGITGSKGEYDYSPDEVITFSLGGVVLGQARGTGRLLLKNLEGGVDGDGQPTRVSVNRAIFLQTLDADGDANNGIQLSAALRDALKATRLDFQQDSTVFANDFTTALAAAGITVPVVTAEAALDHMRQTEAETLGRVQISIKDGVVDHLQRFVVPDLRLPYAGDNAQLKAAFPAGFPLAVGSGLAFDASADGVLTFYGITDRGPNADSPLLLSDGKTATKVFPVPDFAPTLIKLSVDTVGNKGVRVSAARELHHDGVKISGRPLATGVGASGEVALAESLTQTLAFDARGLDTEALVKDPLNPAYAWTCDEYGPFVAKIELASGKIVRKYAPAAELPAVLSQRQPNRGCEGLAITPNGKIYAMLQSTLNALDAKGKSVKNKVLFTRIVEIDRSNEAAPITRMLAYPLNPADWEDGKTGKAKLGDVVAVDDTHLLVMEQGSFSDGKVHNKIYLLDIGMATDISGRMNGALELETITSAAGLADAGVKMATKTLIADLRDYGWLPEKAEGLALVDAQTLALINDNDFALAATAHDGDGHEVDVTEQFVDTASGQISDGAGRLFSYQLKANAVAQRRTQLWLIRLAKPVLQFQ